MTTTSVHLATLNVCIRDLFNSGYYPVSHLLWKSYGTEFIPHTLKILVKMIKIWINKQI